MITLLKVIIKMATGVLSILGYFLLPCWIIGAFFAALMPILALSGEKEVSALTWVALSVFYYMPLVYCMGSKQWEPSKTTTKRKIL